MKTIYLLLLLALACKDGPASKSWDDSVENAEGALSENSDPTPSSTGEVSITEEFMDLLNDHRVGLGLRPLVHHTDMETIAQKHSTDMAGGQVSFGHDGFSSRCSQARQAIGGGNLCAENVANGQKTAKAVFNSWMNSSGHRANIEQARHTHTGFGYKKNAYGIYYWTQIFMEQN